MDAVDDGLVHELSISDVGRAGLRCGDTWGVSDCLVLALMLATIASVAVTDIGIWEGSMFVAWDMPLGGGLKDACESTGVVDEGAGEGYMG